MDKQLIRKYNIPGPRYTSYPTVPYWEDTPKEAQWKQLVKETFDRTNEAEGISLYIHLPYCESLCTYCGCNTRITINHKVEGPYIDTLLKEWQLYLDTFGEKPKIREIHLGGGTPTFFSPENLKKLIEGIKEKAIITEDAELGFEAHPKNTTRPHLQTLYDLGFKRLSLGIQDFDPKVQDIVNRIQPFEMVKEATDNAREVGYGSINFDLIYGLPFQTMDSVKDTIEKVNILRPDRIAFYSYAHVPWIKPGQRRFTEDDLPADEEKRALYELGKEMFEQNGYIEIGMDHFALESDSLYTAMEQKDMHRNFMGYTTNHTELMVGLGASSISDSWTGFIQNIKVVEEYMKAVDEGRFPFFRGHVLTKEDLIVRKHILNLMCHLETEWCDTEKQLDAISAGLNKLDEMVADELLSISEEGIIVTEKGRAYVRNICMAFDARLIRKQPETNIFSSTI